MNNQVTKTFEDWLGGAIIERGEMYGLPVTKDNFEDIFATYLENLEPEDYLSLGTMYGNIQFLEGEKKQIKQRLEQIKELEQIIKK